MGVRTHSIAMPRCDREMHPQHKSVKLFAGRVFGYHLCLPFCKDALAPGFFHNPVCKLAWLVLGGDPAARSHRVEQFTAL